MVQVILANASNLEATKVWDKFESKIKIATKNYQGVAHQKNGEIYFDINEAAAGDVINNPYQLLFHEGAHNIDFLNARNGEYFSEYYENNALIKAIKKDLQKLIEDKMAQLQIEENQAYENLRSELRKNFTLKDRANFSDILSAYSDNDYNLGVGHPKGYWQKSGDALKSREVFADFMDAAITNKVAYEMLKQYLPTASKVFEEMLKELLK